MRVFAALPLPGPALRALDGALEALRREHSRLRWVPPGSYHITLHFFGEVGNEEVARLKALFADPGLRVPPIAARFGEVGRFPPRGAPRVIHVAIVGGVEEARAYSRRFLSTIAPLGYRPDSRGFTPHITLARCPREQMDGSRLPDIAVPKEGFLIEKCVLFQSLLGPAGPRYVEIAAAVFGPGESGA